ncbi:MAG: kelch repeat-containing protein [Acidobacteriota bacterium]
MALASLLCGAMPVSESLAQTVTPGWTMTGALNTARRGHSATLLRDGRVLVAGGTGAGCSSPATRSAELYDAVSGTWTPTGDLTTARSNHTATLLQNGEVLVAGDSAELYDPAAGRWRPTGSFNTLRAVSSATLLPSGKVLAVGSSGTASIAAELYDPATGMWSSTAAPGFVPSNGHTVLLPDGKVLAVSEGSPFDYALADTESYDPATGQWTPAGYLQKFWAPTVTLLRNGKVLVTGLYGANDPTLAELYDPYTRKWSIARSFSSRHSGGYTATLLADGRVLVAGGTDAVTGQNVTPPELFDPATGTSTLTASLHKAREFHTATLLRNGKVLVAGGAEASSSNCDALLIPEAEIYDPGIAPNTTPIDPPTWTLRNSGNIVNPVSDVVLDTANPKLMYATTPAGVFKTTDAGNAWTRSNDLPATALAIAPNNPSVVFAAGGPLAVGGTIDRKTTDGGATWNEFHPDPAKIRGARAIAIDPSNASTVYAVLMEGGLSKSIDGGSTFSYINTGLSQDFYYGFDSTAVAIDPSAPSFLVASNVCINRSANWGANWSSNCGPPIYYASALAIDPSQSAFVYAATYQGLFRSSDGGFGWERLQNGLPSPEFLDIVVDPREGTNLYVAIRENGVYKSSDRGQSWTAFNEGLSDLAVHSLAIDSTGNFLAVATDRGVFTISPGNSLATLPPELHAERLPSDPQRLARLLEQVRALDRSSPPVSPASTGSSAALVFAAAVNAPGAYGTYFRSDVTLMNGRTAPQDAIAVWLAAGSDGTDAPSLRLTLEPSAITITDVVGKMGFTGLGSLLFISIDANANLDTGASLKGFSRIWTPGPGGRGSLSQAFPAVSIASLGGVTAAKAIGLRMDSNFRTNVGVVNLDTTSRTFLVTLTGERQSSTLPIVVEPFSMRQVPVPEGDYGALTALFTVGGGEFPWTAYGSSVDNLTGDGWTSQAAP